MSSDPGARRNMILGRIRERVAAGREGSAERARTVADRIARATRNLIPDRAKLADPERLKALLTAQLRAANATVVEAASPAAVPAVVASYLRSQNLPLALRAGSDPWLGALDWSTVGAATVRTGRAQPDDEVGLTLASAGVAETGTLVLASGPDNPVTVTFLPETSIVVLRRSTLVGPYEDAIDLVRERLGRTVMPRTLNLVSGPSRTADVGGRLVTGAHGPRRLCVVIVDD